MFQKMLAYDVQKIGIRHGYSLSISRDANKIAIDPQYSGNDMQFDVDNTEFFKMKSDDFFGVAKYPTATFVIKEVQEKSTNKFFCLGKFRL